MRWLLGRDPGDCESCGATIVPDASWCGACGAAVGATEDSADALAAAEADAPARGESDRGARGRRVVGALVVLGLLAALVVAGWDRTSPAEPLLGTAAGAGGMSASGPPPEGLRVAWRHDLPDDGVESYSSPGAVALSADAERMAVGGRVVDRESGRLVRLDPWGGSGIELDGDDLVRTDPLTGAIERIGELPEGVTGWPVAVVGGSVVLAGDRGVDLVGPDGEVRAPSDHAFVQHLDRVDEDAVVLPVRTGNGDADDDVVLLDTRDGTEVGTLPSEGASQVVDVLGSTMLRAATTSDVGAPGAGVTWRVTVRTPLDGGGTAEGALTSAAAPRLLGMLGDGTAVVGGRSGATVVVWLLREGQRTVDPFLTTRSPTPTHDSPLGHHGGDITAHAAVVGDLVVVVDAESATVRAVDAAGREAWRVGADGTGRIGVGDGLVALVPEDVHTGRTRVVDGTSGQDVVVVPSGTDQWGGDQVVAASFDGHVAVGGSGWWAGRIALGLVGTQWLDVERGRPVPAADVFEAQLPPDERLGHDWFFHGVTRDVEGARLPVITADRNGDGIQLLGPDREFATVDLGALPGTEVAGHRSEVVGASATHLVLARRSFEDGSTDTYLVDRGTGAVTTLDDNEAIALFGDVVLTVDVAEGGTARRAVAVGVDAGDGTELWRREDATSVIFRDHLVGDARSLLAVGRREVSLMDLRTGTAVWTHQASAALWPMVSVLGPDRVVVATTDGQVVALDRANGSEVWRTALTAPVTSMTGAGTHVLVGTVDGLVVHLDGDGAEVQRVSVGTTPVTSVAALGQTVVAVAGDVVTGLRTDGDGIVEQDEVDLP